MHLSQDSVSDRVLGDKLHQAAVRWPINVLSPFEGQTKSTKFKFSDTNFYGCNRTQRRILEGSKLNGQHLASICGSLGYPR